MKSKQFKLAAAGIGAGAAITMGVLGASFGNAPSPSSTVSDAPSATLGETSTESVAPTEMATSFVTPAVTAEKPAGFANAGGG